MLDVNFQQHQALVDGDLGGIWSFSHWILPETLKNFRVIIKSRQDYIDYKN
jgi:hypothetical protein